MIIYEAFNTINGKSYVGMTTKSLNHRKSQHLRSAKSNPKTHFARALRKYGDGVFEWSVSMECKDFSALCRMERLVIQNYEPWQLYNKSLGGFAPAFGMKHTDETKRICGKYATERWEGKRAVDLWPDVVFTLPTYKEAKNYGIPKTTWYRHRIT